MSLLNEHKLRISERKSFCWRSLSFLLFFCFITTAGMAIRVRRLNQQEPQIIIIRETQKEMTIKAYCACEICCKPFADGITASGELAQGYFVAAPIDIPLGTLIHVPGYADNIYVPVLDRGPELNSNRIEVFFENHQDALDFGIRQEWVTIREVTTWEK